MAKHLIISGVVQGVGYRVSFDAQARALQLSGWVRNRREGTVEALVAGDPAALETIVAWARRGPPGARVDQVMVNDTDDAQLKTDGFQVLPTT